VLAIVFSFVTTPTTWIFFIFRKWLE
jgi:hypothetical protein